MPFHRHLSKGPPNLSLPVKMEVEWLNLTAFIWRSKGLYGKKVVRGWNSWVSPFDLVLHHLTSIQIFKKPKYRIRMAISLVVQEWKPIQFFQPFPTWKWTIQPLFTPFDLHTPLVSPFDLHIKEVEWSIGPSLFGGQILLHYIGWVLLYKM